MDEQQFDGMNGVIWSEANLTGLEIYSTFSFSFFPHFAV